jgi:putative peptide zinc metalloprotease protein
MIERSSSSLQSQKTATEQVGLVRRRDIKWTRSAERGESRFVASDPLKPDFFSCSEADYTILQWVAPAKTYQQLCNQFNEHYRPATLSISELQRLLIKCVQSGILQPQRGTKRPIVSAGSTHTATRRHGIVRFASAVVNLVQYQLSFGSPGRLLDIVTRPLSILFAPSLVPFAILLFVLAGLGIAYRWDEFLMSLPTWSELRSPSSLIGYGLIFVTTRAIHELGHASACKYYQLECRDMGLLMSFGMICPYVDISEGWKSKNRFHRLTTALGGIYFELIVASIAALIWCFTTSSLTNALCYQTLLVCSLTTLLFNANPLMKYDGYYIFSDALGINNLREKSWQAFDRLADGRLDSSIAQQIGLSLYYIGSLLNRFILIGTLAWFAYRIAGDWQLTGLAITAFFLYGLCALILWIASWTQQSKANGKRIPLRAQIVGWAGAACVAVWAMTLPLPKRSWGIGIFKPGDTVSLYASESGVIDHLSHADGERVAAGETIMVLRNPDLLKEKFKLQSSMEQVTAKLKSMDGAAYHNSQILDQKKIVESRLRAIQIQVEEIERKLRSLDVKATQAGYFKANLSMQDKEAGLLVQASYQSSKQQSRSPQLSPGVFLPKNSLIGGIATSDDPHVECELHKDEVDFISVGTPVVMRLSTHPDKILRGIVSKVSAAIVAHDAPRAILDNRASTNESEKAIGKVLLRIDCEELRTVSGAYGHVEIMFHHFDQSMWDYIVDAVLRNTRWR